MLFVFTSDELLEHLFVELPNRTQKELIHTGGVQDMPGSESPLTRPTRDSGIKIDSGLCRSDSILFL
jgi:hypothetical protein